MKTPEEILNTFVNFQVDMDGKETFKVAVLKEDAVNAINYYHKQFEQYTAYTDNTPVIASDSSQMYVKTAYGAYSGSYDGGGVSSPLYWNINDARNKCLELVKEIDKDNARMLKFSLQDAKTQKEKDYYKNQYPKMKEFKGNKWKNKFDHVYIVEYDIL